MTKFMIKLYVDRNVNVQKMKSAIKDALGHPQVDFIQWPIEGKSKRIREYGFPAGDLDFDDMNDLDFDDLGDYSWDDFQSTKKYEKILAIMGKENRKDCIHLDIAIKNGCPFFLTSDNDFLREKEELVALCQVQIYDPDKKGDLKCFLKNLKEILSLSSSPQAS